MLGVPDLGQPLTQGEDGIAFVVLLFLTQGSDIFAMEDSAMEDAR